MSAHRVRVHVASTVIVVDGAFTPLHVTAVEAPDTGQRLNAAHTLAWKFTAFDALPVYGDMST
jgi:hypothetical protein